MKKHLEELDILGNTLIENVITPEEAKEVITKLEDTWKIQEQEVSDKFDIREIAENNIVRAPFAYDDIFYKTLKRLFAIAIIPFIIFYFASPVLFELVFGEKWLVAGQYAQIFTIPLFLNFIASSLSSIFYLKEKTQIYSRLSFLQLSLVIFAFLLSQHYDLESKLLIYLLAIAYTISYSLMIFILVKIVED